MSLFKRSNTLKLVFVHSLGANTRVRGDISFEKGMLVEGCVDGVLTGAAGSALAVGKNGQVNGGIHADTVLIEGNVHGPIQAQRIVLTPASQVKGDLIAQCVDIQAGATFEGKVTICPPTQDTNVITNTSASVAKDRLKAELAGSQA